MFLYISISATFSHNCSLFEVVNCKGMTICYTVKLGYNELGYNELGYNELGYDEQIFKLNWSLHKLTRF
jgi:hypothetical protein